MIPNAYSDIKTKDADRQHLNDAVAQFLATGGKVDNLSPPPAASQAVAKAAPGPRPATTAPAADPSGERRAARKDRRATRYPSRGGCPSSPTRWHRAAAEQPSRSG